MKIARASKQDIDAAFELLGLLDMVGKGYYPSDTDHEDDGPLLFKPSDAAHLAQFWKRLDRILDISPGAMGRVIFGGCTLLDPRLQVIDPDSDTLDFHPRLRCATDTPEPLGEWREDIGPAVWWSFPAGSASPLDEPAWIGSPLDSDWPGYHTHWTPHPAAPKLAEVKA